MIDFFVREARAVVEGDIAIVRFGSCGSLDPSFGCGSLGVPLAAMSVTTNYAVTRGVDQGEPYLFSPPVRSTCNHLVTSAHTLPQTAADPALHATVCRAIHPDASTLIRSSTAFRNAQVVVGSTRYRHSTSRPTRLGRLLLLYARSPRSLV